MISRATAQHASSIAKLFHASVHSISDHLYGPDQREAWAPTPPDAAFWRTRIQCKHPWIFIRDGQLAGFIELDPDGHIDCCYVHPDFQRRGIGSALLYHVEALANAADLPELDVDVSKAALALFLKHGFIIEGSINDVVRNGVALQNYKMKKPLE